ncbi:MAG: hypothetical protein AB7T63_09870 [Planctomycetota bacterium]
MTGLPGTDDERAASRVIVGVLLLGAALWMARAHLETVEGPYAERKAELHEQILAGTAPDPYQYKCHVIERVLEEVRVRTGAPLETVFRWNTLLGLVALVLAHHVWLRTYVGPRDALLGGLVLVGVAHVMFRWQFHHPYEPWGLAGACLLLRAHEREAPLGMLALGSLALGMVWEKHAAFAALAGLLRLVRGRPLLRTTLSMLVVLAASLAVPLAVRWSLGGHRGHIDGDSPWWNQDLHKTLWFQAPWIAPLLVALLVGWARVPTFVRIGWLALPLGVAAYVSQHYILHEPRSFWIVVPFATATVATALAPRTPAAQREAS